jgi:outer membrane protein TolC
MKMARIVSNVAFMLCISHLAAAQTNLGLSQAVDAALESHPLMRLARLGIDQADNRAAEVRSERIPKIRLTENVIRSNNPVFVFGSLLEQGRFTAANFALPSLNNPASLTNLRTVLSANVPVFDGMKTSSRIAQTDVGKRQATQQERMAEQRVRFEVVGEYFGALVAQAGFDVANQAVRMAESDVQRARDREDAGLAVESDLLAAQVQLAEFKQQRIQAQGDVATALAVLNVSMGARSAVQRNLTVQLLRKTFSLAAPDDLVSRALLTRPDYLQAESGIEIATQRVSERRSEYVPEFNVFGSFGLSGRSLTTGSTDYTIGLGISVNLFDRGRPSRLDQAYVDKRLAQTERDRIADQIEVEVIRAYNRYRAAEEQVDVAEAALSQAAESLRIIQDRYEAGLTTITDVLRAESSLVRTRMNVAVSRHDHYLGYANVLLSIGELNDVKAFEP